MDSYYVHSAILSCLKLLPGPPPVTVPSFTVWEVYIHSMFLTFLSHRQPNIFEIPPKYILKFIKSLVKSVLWEWSRIIWTGGRFIAFCIAKWLCACGIRNEYGFKYIQPMQLSSFSIAKKKHRCEHWNELLDGNSLIFSFYQSIPQGNKLKNDIRWLMERNMSTWELWIISEVKLWLILNESRTLPWCPLQGNRIGGGGGGSYREGPCSLWLAFQEHDKWNAILPLISCIYVHLFMCISLEEVYQRYCSAS